MANLDQNIRNAIREDSKNTEEDSNTSSLLNRIIDEDGTMLHIATKLGDLDITRLLLSLNPDLTICNKSGLTPFKMSSAKDHAIKQVYLQNFCQQITTNNLNGLKLLIEGGINPKDVTLSFMNNSTPMHWAALYGTPETITFLYEKGVDIYSYNDKGYTALHEAIMSQKLENARCILQLEPSIAKYKPVHGIHKDKEISELIKAIYPDSRESSVHNLMDEISKLSLITNGNTNEKQKHHSKQSKDDNMVLKCVKNVACNNKNSIDCEQNDIFKILWPRPRNITNNMEDNYFIQNENSQNTLDNQIKGQSSSPKTSFILPPHVNVCLMSKIPTVITVIKMWEVWEIFRESFSALGSVLMMVPAPQKRQSQIVCCMTPHYNSFVNNKNLALKQTHVNDKERKEHNSTCDWNGSLEQGYRITVTGKQIVILCRDIPGLYYGIMCVRETLRAVPDFIIPRVTIKDWPCFPCRSVLIDISHNGGRIPKIGYLTRFIDLLAALKYNQLYLHYSATIYSNMESKNIQSSSPYTPLDILFLERYCQECCIQLLPAIDVSIIITPKIESSFGELKDIKSLESNLKSREKIIDGEKDCIQRELCQYLRSFSCAKDIYVGSNLSHHIINEISANYVNTTKEDLGDDTDDPLSFNSCWLNLLQSQYGLGETNLSLQLNAAAVILGNIDSISSLGKIEYVFGQLAPDINISLTISPQNDWIKQCKIINALEQTGCPYTITCQSAWYNSLAGNFKSDFPNHFNVHEGKKYHQSSNHVVEQITETNHIDSNTNNDDDVNCQNLSLDDDDKNAMFKAKEFLHPHGYIYAIGNFGVVTNSDGDNPTFVDHLFAWPALLTLSSYLWSGTLIKEQFYGKTLPYILSWHIFPQDVECVLSNTLLELMAIENDLNCKAGRIFNSGEIADSCSNLTSFAYQILKCPDEVDIQNFTVEYFNKMVKILRKINNNLTAWQKKHENALELERQKPSSSSSQMPSSDKTMVSANVGNQKGVSNTAKTGPLTLDNSVNADRPQSPTSFFSGGCSLDSSSSNDHTNMANRNVGPSPTFQSPLDTLISNLYSTIELLTLACKIAKALLSAGIPTNLSSAQNGTTTDSVANKIIINPGITNINSIAKTDLANKVLDTIATFKANWLEHYMDINLDANVLYLERLFHQLVPGQKLENL